MQSVFDVECSEIPEGVLAMPMSEEHRQKIREANHRRKGILVGPHSEERKAQIRASTKATWQAKVADPEWESPLAGRVNPGQSERMKRRYEDDEYAAKNAAHLISVRPSVPARGPRPKQSESLKRRYREDPDFRARNAEQLRSVAANGGAVGGKRPWSEESKQKLSASKVGWWSEPVKGLERREAAAQRASEIIARFRRDKPTSLETILYGLLEKLGIAFIPQHKIGTKFVDAYLLDGSVVLEADGDYWHRDSGKDRNRDLYLLSQGVILVIHLSETTLKTYEREGK